MTATEPWQRVGHAVRNQRLHLGWTQQEAAERANVSLATWRLIESGGRDRYQDLTVRGVCRAFGWPTDAFTTILEGGEAPAVESDDRPGPGASATEPTSPDESSLPAGFARKYLELTPREQAMVQGYLEGLVDRRNRPDRA
jgi:transcriptional regulator with XRE-family HTH domain